MIIKSLKINNIYSLQGHHSINFEKMQKHSSLLAITGKTGAGKSTILNCISLALFGKTHIKSLTKEDYLTLGEKKGSIELTFTIKGSEYKVSWSVTVKGSLSRKITHNDEVITHGINEKIIEIIKLNFDQFNKTIILNQGEFANFISSTFAQRKDILEELTDVQNLKKLSQTVKLQIKQLEQEFSQLESSLSASTIMSPKEETELTQQLNILKDDIKETQQKEKDLKSIFTTYKTVHDNSTRFLKNQQSILKCDSEVREITSRQNDLKKELDVLNQKTSDQTKEFSKLLPKIQQAQTLEQQNIAQKNKQSFILQEQAGIKTDLDKLEKNLQSTNQAYNQNQLKIDQLCEKQTALKEITTTKDLSEIRNSLRDIALNRQNIQNINEQITNSNAEIQSTSKKDQAVKSRLSQLYSTHKITELHQIAELIEKSKINLQENEQRLRDKQLLSDKLIEKSKSNTKLESALKEVNTAIDKSIQSISLLKKELELEQLSTQEVAKLIVLNELDRAIDLVKHENMSKESCVVCDSKLGKVEYTQSTELVDIHELENKKKKHEANIHEISLSIEKEQLKQSSLLKEKNVFDNELKQVNILLDNNDLKGLEIELSKIKDYLKEVSSAINDLYSSQKEGSLLTEQLNDFKIRITDLKKQIEQKQLLFNANSEKESQTWKSIYSSLSITDRTLQNIPMDELESFCDLSIAHTQLSKEQDRAKEQQNKVKIQNAHLIAESQAIDDLISKNIDDITKLIGKDTNSQQVQKDWENKLSQLKSTALDKQSELDSLEFQRRDLQGRLDVLHSQIVLIQQDSQNELSKIAKSNFESDNKVIDKAVHFKDKISLMITTPTDNSLKEFMFFIEDLIQKPLEALQFELDQLKRQHAKISERLAVHEEQKVRQQEMLKRSGSIQDKLAPKKELFQIIGNDEFRNYLLTLIEKQLLSQSNIELQSLCSGRYKIIQRNSEFYIIDGNLQGQLRKISTLSGGEKFMVSLAMALGLAEMTRGAAKVDSFFIDEGFGSLDSEALDEVLDVLNEVQARGKSITIITHIKDLYRRIPVNLHVKKQNDGRSTIQTVFN